MGDKDTDLQVVVEDTDVTGTNILVDFNARATTLIELLVIDPDGVVTPFVASLLNPPGSDGIIHYVNIDATLFDQPGPWEFKGRITFTVGGPYTSNPIIREVLG